MKYLLEMLFANFSKIALLVAEVRAMELRHNRQQKFRKKLSQFTLISFDKRTIGIEAIAYPHRQQIQQQNKQFDSRVNGSIIVQQKHIVSYHLRLNFLHLVLRLLEHRVVFGQLRYLPLHFFLQLVIF